MTEKNIGFALNFIDDLDTPLAQRIRLTEKPVPNLEPGQVLVKMLASPVNPSDLVYLLGKYGLPPVDGAYAGFEGCGVVMDANAGMYGKWLVGKRVALSAQPGSDGVWAKYAVTTASHCLPVRSDIGDNQAATLIVNPCTSVCLVERAKQLGSKAVVLNAAASQVGKGVIRYAKMLGMQTIAIVRSQSNVKVLQQLGADVVLNSKEANYDQQLQQGAKQLKAKVFLDAVADEQTAHTMSLLPTSSTAIVYGRLTETLHPYGGQYGVADLIFKDQRIEGFWLATYMGQANPLKILALSRKVQKLFADGVFKTDIYGEFGPDNFAKALEHYANHKSDGKVILSFK